MLKNEMKTNIQDTSFLNYMITETEKTKKDLEKEKTTIGGNARE